MKTEKIDLVRLLLTVWERRRFVMRVAGVVVFCGLLAALFGEVKYTSRVVMVPQTGEQMQGGNLQGLAAMAGMAGIDLGGLNQSAGLSPNLYPMVVASVPFQKELMHTAVPAAGHDKPVTLVDYFTERGYRRFSLFPFIADYTVGLPRTLMNAIHRRRSADDIPGEGGEVETLSVREHECMRRLSHRIVVKVDEKNGYIALAATMPQASMAAHVTSRAQQLLQDYITRFKVQKVQADLDFIEERYDEVKVDFETRQRALAAFQDSHRNITSALARTQESRLENEYQLSFSLYSELARQREQARIKVKEDTPVFTIVEPVTVPLERAAPKRALILIISLFLGIALGAVLAVAIHVFAKSAPRKKRLNEQG